MFEEIGIYLSSIALRLSLNVNFPFLFVNILKINNLFDALENLLIRVGQQSNAGEGLT